MMHKDAIRLRRLRPESLKRLIEGVVFLIALTTLSTIWLWREANEKRQNDLRQILQQKTELINARFDHLFDPVLLDLQALREMSESGILSLDNVELLRAIVEPILGKYRQREDPNGVAAGDPNELRRNILSGFMLANERGSEFKLIHMDNQWQQVSSPYRPQEQPWFKGAVLSPKNAVYWAESHRSPTTGQLGMIVSIAFEPDDEVPTHVLAFDIVLEDVANYIETLGLADNDRLFLGQDADILDLTDLEHAMEDDVSAQTSRDRALEDPVILAALATAAKVDPDKPEPASFKTANEKWWVHRVPFQYGNSKGQLYLAAPEAQLGSQIKTRIRWLAVLMFCILVALAAVLAWLLLGHGTMLQEALTYSGHIHDSAEDLAQTIRQGENDVLEFKSTLRWNLRTDKPAKDIELACVKTIVAFMNSEGGTLLVGVEDDGNILGIEADHFANEDKLLLHFNNLVRQHIGLEYSKYVLFSVTKVGPRSVLVVDCQKSDKPVFLRDKDAEDFYVRVGPGTRKLSTREVLRYLRSGGLGPEGANV